MTKTEAPRHAARSATKLIAVLFTAGMLLVASGFLSKSQTNPNSSEVLFVPGELQGKGLIPNGGFENDFFGWTVVDSAAISNDPVHTGVNAFRAMDPDSSRYAYVYQELGFAYDTTEVSFWVYPESDTYYQFFELISNWHPGPALFITHVTLRDDILGFNSQGTTEWVPNVLVPHAWNHIMIKANSTTLTQDFYVNDSLYASITTDELPVMEHLLAGDLSLKGNYGTLYYDDISITGSVKTPAPVAVDDEFVADGSAPKFFPVLHNDIVPPGVTVEIVIDVPPEHGQILSIEEDGFWFQKDEGFEGEDQLSYSLAVLSPGSMKKTFLADGASMIYQAYVCACYMFTSYGDFNDCLGLGKLSGSFNERFGLGQASLVDSVDVDLLIRWRDELLRSTDAGSALFDDMVFHSPEIHQLVLIDRPEFVDRILRIFLMLEEPARNLLDGDGSELITQAQMDSLDALFTSLRGGLSDEAGGDLERNLAALRPFDDYVGLTTQEAFQKLQTATGTSVEEEVPSASTGFVLEQNFPNPFGDATTIRFVLDDPKSISLAIFDIRGRRVRTLIDQQLRQGTQTVTWDGRDDRGVDLPSGVYLVRLATDDFHQSRRVVHVR